MPARCKLVELYVRVHSAKRSKLAELSNDLCMQNCQMSLHLIEIYVPIYLDFLIS